LALGTLGDLDEGAALAQEGLRLAEEADHPYSVIVSGWGLGSVYTIRGNLADAARVFERARRVCQEWHQTVLLPLVGGCLAYVEAVSGRVVEGRALLQEALDGMQSMRRGAYHSLLVLQLGEAAARVHRFGEALDFAEQALTLARQRGERGYEAHALHLLRQIDAHRT